MTAVLSLLLNPRVLGVIAVVAVLAGGYWHYTALRADLADAREAAADARAQADRAIAIAEDNAAQLEKEREAHRAVVAALEDLHEELSDLTEEARREDEIILSSPPEADGPMPPVLGDYLLRRFGG